MTAPAIVLASASGLALGLASTLHCAGMCGGISCSLLLAQERGGAKSLAVAFAVTHLGRIIAYAGAGALVGVIGAPAIGWLDRDTAFRLLQWAAATSLIWIGLSTAGLLPSLRFIDRGLGRIADVVARTQAGVRGGALVPLLSGMAWGLMPCAMVYAALFSALLTGSILGGAVTMLAFGIGTLPGLVATSFGFRYLTRATRAAPGRLIAGLAIALFGMMTVLIAHPQLAYLCMPGGVTRPHASGGLDRHQAVGGVGPVGSGTVARETSGSGDGNEP